MPNYLFQNPNTEEIIELFQKIDDTHEYIDSDGLKWDRLFTKPQIATDIKPADPYSKSEFLSKTQNKKDSIGKWWQRSQELSEKRADKDGIDPVKEKYYEDYSKKRKGKQLLEVRKRKVKDKLDKMGVILE